MFRSLVLYSLLATGLAAPSSHDSSKYSLLVRFLSGPFLTSGSSSSSSAAPAQCLPTDIEGSLLDNTVMLNASGQVACSWQIACDCIYNSPSGTLASGSSSCPKSIMPGPRGGSSSSSSGSKASSGKLNQELEETSSSSTRGWDNRLSPAVIVGLVINGVFVLGMKVLYTSVDDTRETFVPLTHGTTEGAYYDPHEDKNKSGSAGAGGNNRFEHD
ncbi:hypothetical protein C8F01DRAFT_1104905 [Mycena amicta]|nr:hypothetical protein C8F01DRAFT_1104905 [Mycena amicta]